MMSTKQRFNLPKLKINTHKHVFWLLIENYFFKKDIYQGQKVKEIYAMLSTRPFDMNRIHTV